MSQVINRRTVVRGAAWSIPVVAVAANAPAFAASTDAPSISSVSACKDPGTGSNCQGYRFSVVLNVQPGYTWTINLTEVSIENTNRTTTTTPLTFLGVSSDSSTLNFTTCTETDSASFKFITVKYSATNNLGVTTSNLGVTNLKVTGISPCPK